MEKIKYQAEKFVDVDVRVLFIPRKSDECIEILTKNNVIDHLLFNLDLDMQY